MSCVVRLLPCFVLFALGILTRTFHTLLTKAHNLFLAVLACFDHMTLRGMARSLPWFIASHLVFGQLGRLRSFFRFIAHG